MKSDIQTTDRRLTHSCQQTFMKCQRKYALAYHLRLRPIHNADPLRMGNAWHEGVGAYESGIPIDGAIQMVADMYEAAECPPWMTPDDMAVEFATVCGMVRGHHWKYGSDQAVETVEVEREFNLPIFNPDTGRPTPNFTSAGKIDRIAKLPDGRIALFERKTTRDDIAPDSDYWKKLLMDSQLSRYWLAGRAVGHEIQTIIYDVMKKPGIRPKKISKADVALATSNGHYYGLPLAERCPEQETPAMYGARLFADIQDRPDFYLARREFARMDSDLEEFRREEWTILHQIRDCEKRVETVGLAAFPRNTGACIGFGTCAYLPICRNCSSVSMDSVPDGFCITPNTHPELKVADDD